MRIGDYVGCYRLVRLLAQGGMGAVYEAYNDQLDRRVAVKFLHPTLAHDPEQNLRFLNEARIVNLISHPSLVTIPDYGVLPNGSAYIAMEYLDGQTLSQRMKAHGGAPLPVDQAIRIARQVAAALAAAHEKDVVHRDLKPDNLMIVVDHEVSGGERVKVLDFGIAKVKKKVPSLPGETRAGVGMGTPGYIAPEQIFGASSVDGRADVYSLGVIMYEMLSGSRPFCSDSGDQEMKFHLTRAPPALLERMPRIPPAMAGLVHAMLAKQPEMRPTMGEVVEHLRAFEFPTPSVQFYGQATPSTVPLLTMAGVALAALLLAFILLAVRQPSGNGPSSARTSITAATGLAVDRFDAGAKLPAPQPLAQVKADMGQVSSDGGAAKSPTKPTLPKDRFLRSKSSPGRELDPNENFIIK